MDLIPLVIVISALLGYGLISYADLRAHKKILAVRCRNYERVAVDRPPLNADSEYWAEYMIRAHAALDKDLAWYESSEHKTAMRPFGALYLVYVKKALRHDDG